VFELNKLLQSNNCPSDQNPRSAREKMRSEGLRWKADDGMSVFEREKSHYCNWKLNVRKRL
jgi:hypothetical protein